MMLGEAQVAGLTLVSHTCSSMEPLHVLLNGNACSDLLPCWAIGL